MSDTPKHRVYVASIDIADGRLVLTGDEARHALRVKRVREGQRVAVHDGQGRVLLTEVAEAKKQLVLTILEDATHPRLTPRIEVYAATPKGPRAATLVDLLSQTGADSWTPLETAFGTETVNDARHERLERVAVEALKQCARAHLLDITAPAALAEALDIPESTELVIADASGESYTPKPNTDTTRVLVGPEGGWREDELRAAIDARASPCRFGHHTMRIETAAPVACAIIRDARNRA